MHVTRSVRRRSTSGRQPTHRGAVLGLLTVLGVSDLAAGLFDGVPSFGLLLGALVVMLLRPWPRRNPLATGHRLRGPDHVALDAVDVLFVVALSRLSGLVAGSWDWPWEVGLVAAACPPCLVLWRWFVAQPPAAPGRSHRGRRLRRRDELRAAMRVSSPASDLAAAPVGLAVAWVLTWLFDDGISLGDLAADPSPGRLVVSCIVVAAVGCALDEVLYRLALPLVLRPYLGRWLVVVLAIAYGAPFFGWWSPTAGAVYTAVGLALGVARTRQLSLVGAMIGHTALSTGLLVFR